MKVVFNGEEVETQAKRIVDLLKERGISPETVVVKRNGQITLEEEELKEGDEIQTIRVVSGG